MTHPSILFLPDLKNFIIECDVSGDGIRVVLMQDNRPIAFLSQAFKGINLLLFTYEKELLALVITVKKWGPYLLDSTFVIKTNNHNLNYLLEQKVSTSTQHNWISILLGYEFFIEFKHGRANKVVDVLS